MYVQSKHIGIRLGRSRVWSHRAERSEGVLRSDDHHLPNACRLQLEHELEQSKRPRDGHVSMMHAINTRNQYTQAIHASNTRKQYTEVMRGGFR